MLAATSKWMPLSAGSTPGFSLFLNRSPVASAPIASPVFHVSYLTLLFVNMTDLLPPSTLTPFFPLFLFKNNYLLLLFLKPELTRYPAQKFCVLLSSFLLSNLEGPFKLQKF